jgi:hypothetical protein
MSAAPIDADDPTTVMDRAELFAAQSAAALLPLLTRPSAELAVLYREFVLSSMLNVPEMLLAVLDDVSAEQP